MRTLFESAHLVAFMLAGIVLTGCASVASRVPAFPTAPEQAVRQDRDAARCVASALGAKTDAAQDEMFAACMLASGYRVALPVRVAVDHARLDIQARGERPVSDVLGDLQSCRRVAETARQGRASSAELVAGRIGGLTGSDPAQVRPHTAKSDLLERVYTACLSPRGYVVRPWQPQG